ncbi:MAG: hypothetical protein FJZ58_03350, partial [Chlamydiae bacterium]|nr:hypothetical protein [Chlamydiota bacterium]
MTKRSLLLSCFLLFLSPLAADSPEDLFLSTPEEISTLTADPEYLIGGLVSPMSGHPILRKVDLIAKGAQDVVLQRTYLPFRLLCHAPHCVDDPDGVCKKIEQQQQIAHSYRGWQFYQHLYIHKVRTKQGTYVSVPDPSGVVLSFVMQGKGELKLKRLLDCMTNVQGEEPSGRYDLRNTRVFLLDHDHIKVDAPDATTRFYTRRAESFRLEKEVLPNGKVLQFHYDKEDKLKSIRSMDPKERHTYAWIELEGKDRATTSTGLSVDYQYEQRGALQEDLTLPPLLTRVSSPFYRNENLEYCDGFLLGLYRENREFFTPKYTGFGSPAHYRVSSLLFPVGSSDALVPLFDIEYQLAEQESKTTVRHSDGSMTCYFFSKQFLLTRIQYLNPEGRVRKEKRFFWNQDNHLEALELLGEQGRLYRRSYEYDRFGNPIVEYLTGDLTGRGVEETACTRRTFSEDGRNLLLREETEDQKVLYFFYLPGTNLMVKKYINAWDRILLREFREYDEANNLLCIIEDDGHHEDKDDLSGVTQRRITRYILRQHQPFLHRPEWIEESYIDPLHPQEVLFKKTHLHYDAWGNVVQEEVLGANGSFLYTIHTTYDERGNILSKTNKLGQRAEYQYDDRGRLCSFTPFSHRCHVTYHLDTRGRLVRKEERGDDGLLRTFHTAYDTYDRILQEQDFLGNIITYTYDSFVNQPVRTNFPSVLSMEGQVMPVTTQAVYDAFGRKVKEIDACGNTTQYRYNIYGSPSQITHSDGGIERLYYTKQGVLQTHIDQEGLRVDLEVDVLARITKKIYSSRQHLATESFIYSGFSLLSQQDKEGLITSYLYDG